MRRVRELRIWIRWDAGTIGGAAVSASQRTKGANGERELCRILRDHGLPAQRTAPLQANSAARDADVLSIPGWHLEVRRRNQISIVRWSRETEAAAPTGKAPVVLYRPDREPWRASLLLADLIPLWQLQVAL